MDVVSLDIFANASATFRPTSSAPPLGPRACLPVP